MAPSRGQGGLALKKALIEEAGCLNLVALDKMPHESTGHVDMWVKFIDDDTLLVGEMREDTISSIPDGDDRKAAMEIRDFLEKQAVALRGVVKTIVRLPMPAPQGGMIRSYVNSLIVNDTLIVPRYKRGVESPMFGIPSMDFAYHDASMLDGYEAEVTEVLAKLGREVEFIEADIIISQNGAIHCVTSQFPVR